MGRKPLWHTCGLLPSCVNTALTWTKAAPTKVNPTFFEPTIKLHLKQKSKGLNMIKVPIQVAKVGDVFCDHQRSKSPCFVAWKPTGGGAVAVAALAALLFGWRLGVRRSREERGVARTACGEVATWRSHGGIWWMKYPLRYWKWWFTVDLPIINGHLTNITMANHNF